MVCLIFFFLFCSSKKTSYQMLTTNFASIFLFMKAFCIQINFTCSMFSIVSFANRQKIARALGLIHNTVQSPICKKKEAKYNLIQFQLLFLKVSAVPFQQLHIQEAISLSSAIRKYLCHKVLLSEGKAAFCSEINK